VSFDHTGLSGARRPRHTIYIPRVQYCLWNANPRAFCHVVFPVKWNEKMLILWIGALWLAINFHSGVFLSTVLSFGIGVVRTIGEITH
jgi:hypothetical protein